MSSVSATPGDPTSPEPTDRHGRLIRKVDTLAVPGVGCIAPLETAPWVTVFDSEGAEVALVTTALQLLKKPKTTRLAYAKAMLRLCRFLWAIDANPETMTRRDYRDYRRWLSHCHQLPVTMRPPTRHDPKRKTDVTAHLAGSTVAQAEAAARTLYRALEEHEVIEESPIPPAAGTLVMKGSNPLDMPRHFSRNPEDTAKSLKGLGPIVRQQVKYPVPLPEHVRAHLLADPDPRGSALWRFMVESGPRINEVLTMTPERMFLDQNYVDVIGKGLGGETRWVPISHEAVILFRRYQEFLASRGVHLRNGEPIWRSMRRPHEPISDDGIRAALATRIDGITDRDYSPHMLRHTAATTMLTELGMDITYVKRVLGHAHLASTQRYLHADLTLATQAFTDAWRNGRKQAAVNLEDLYPAQLLNNFFGAIDE